MQHKSWRNGSIVAMVMLLLMASLLTVTFAPTSTVGAQEDPTATPRDPAWLGFSTARLAVEEAEEIDLSLVRRWDFHQDDWSIPNANHPQQAAGIDSCVSTVIIAQGRPVYFGWTYIITDINGNVHEARVSFDLLDIAICDILSVPVTAASADPEATQDPATGNLPAPIAGSGATGSFELGGHIDGMTSEAVAAMQRSGMTWVKEQVPLSAGVQYGIDRINAAHANGFKILVGLVGNRDAVGVDPTGHAQTMADVAAQLAAAGADAIEVWNETNIDREWPTGQVSGANYTALLAIVSNAIRGANPSTMVISAAPAPTGYFGAAGCTDNGCNDDVFMQQMADAGAGQYIDCVGIHYNEGVLPPSAYSNDPRGNYPTYFFGSMVNRAAVSFPGKPICFTELGYLSGEGMGSAIPPSFDWTPNDPVTVAEQAAYLAEAASLAAQRGDIRIMIIWNINFTRWDSDPMGGYAIIRPGGSCAACDALGAVMGG